MVPSSTKADNNDVSTTAISTHVSVAVEQKGEAKYRALVIDSGPIIRLAGLTTLWRRADSFYTVPAVLQEIRDAKARQHLNTLPFELKTREPSAEAIQAVVEFSRQTGDYPSLSSVDLQVLALLYDLEKEGCADMSHVRKTPKRTVGVGKIQILANDAEGSITAARLEPQVDHCGMDDYSQQEAKDQSIHDDGESTVDEYDDESVTFEDLELENVSHINDLVVPASAKPPKTWAALVNPIAASKELPKNDSIAKPVFDQALHIPFGRMSLRSVAANNNKEENGQFSDADSDRGFSSEDEESDDDFDSNQEISDEECDVYILDPEEVERKNKTFDTTVQDEHLSDFPSLAASIRVPYEEANDDERDAQRQIVEDRRKQKSLQPVSNSGKLYNSFRKYTNLMKPKAVIKKNTPKVTSTVSTPGEKYDELRTQSTIDNTQSRIIGGTAFAGQDADFVDDGEGWITSTKEIKTLRAAGSLDPMKNLGKSGELVTTAIGPSVGQRAACTTTDFAMQNVILQMNLELLSVDGIKVRKLKSWVTRCGACYKVYTSHESSGPLGKRLFCERCGSDMIQRIAASVDGKTGRLRLHLSKRYRHNLRGTKYSLPKSGSGNRFQGDLLLREDQLLMGAWNQKVKMRGGGKSRSDAQSMFGRDIASNVGCHTSAVSGEDIRVGFGRRNPNSAKGRERRGKKKKTADRACGLRRY